MANRAYLRIWTREFSRETMIAQFVRFLATVPLSAPRNSFDNLVIQAIDPTETPVSEWDFREGAFGAPEVAAIASQHIHEDTAYIVAAQWDLLKFESERLKWKQGPHPLEIIGGAPDYDDGASAGDGQCSGVLGFDHLFTGHAGIMARGAAANPFDIPDPPIERTFGQ